jgi:uncharacterized repeat protein (TIGR01451 family)
MHKYRFAQTLIRLFVLLAILLGSTPGASAHTLTVGSKTASNQLQRPPLQAAGGPDAAGYTVVDNDEPGGPSYQFNSIASTGTAMVAGGLNADDTCFGPVGLGLTFPFYGQAYTDIYVSSNGYLSFEADCGKNLSAAPPSTLAPDALIAPFLDDMYVTDGISQIYVQTAADPDRVIIEFVDLDQYDPRGNLSTAQVVLFANGNIRIYYAAVADASATAGIENQDGTIGLAYGGTLAAGRAIDFYAPGQARANLTQSSKRIPQTPVAPGDVIAYTITLDNSGDQTASSVTLLDTLPAEMSYVVGSLTYASGVGSYVSATHQIAWTGEVVGGTQVPVQYQTRADDTLSAYTLLTNNAIISSPDIAADITVEATACISCGLASSAGPLRHGDMQRTNRSATSGPLLPGDAWKHNLNAPVQASPIILEDGSIVGAGTNGQIAVLAPDGTLQRSYAAGGTILSTPAAATGGTLYVGVDTDLVALVPAGSSLSESWRFPTGGTVESSPLVAPDGTIYVGSSDGKLYAVAPDGSERWSYDAGAVIGMSSPTLGRDGTLYIGTASGLVAVAPDGSAHWNYALGDSSDATPTIDSNDSIYIGAQNGELAALDPDGSERWRTNLGAPITSSPTVGSSGTIYVPAGDTLYAVSFNGSSVLWSAAMGDTISSTPLVDGAGKIYIASSDGTLSMFYPDGTRQTTYSISGAFGYSMPVIDKQGTLYIGALDNELYALQETASDLASSTISMTPPAPGADDIVDITLTVDNTGGSPVTNTEILLSIPPELIYIPGSEQADSGSITVDSVNNELRWSGNLPGLDTLQIGYQATVAASQTAFGVINNTATISAPLLSAIETIETPICINCGPVSTVHTMLGIDYRRSGQSLNAGPTESIWPIWSTILAGEINASPVISPDGTILIGADNVLYAFDESRTLLWTSNVGAPLISTPALGAGGAIYVGAGTDLVALSGEGDVRWSYSTGGNVFSSPLIGADGMIYVGANDGVIYAIDPTGSLAWSYPTGLSIRYSSPAVVNDTLYIGTSKYVYALDATTGAFHWRYEVGDASHSTPSVGADGTIYIGTRAGFVYALQPDGMLAWVYDTGEPVYGSPIEGTDGRIYVAAGNDLLAIAADGNQSELLHSTGNQLFASPVLDINGNIHIGSSDGAFVMVSPDGTLIGSYQTTGAFAYTSAAIALDGTIYIGTDDGQFYAFVPDERPTDITLSNNRLDENDATGSATPTGTFIGTFSASSNLTNDQFSYVLLEDAEGRFQIGGSNGDELQVGNASLLDYETNTQHTITISATNQRNLSIKREFTIFLDPVNEYPPTDLAAAPDPLTVNENSTNGTNIGSLSFTDMDEGDNHRYAIQSDPCGNCFGVTGSTLVVQNGLGLDYEAATEYTLLLRVTDSGDEFDELSLTIKLNNINEIPIANADVYSVMEDPATPLSVAAPGVLDNDTDPEGNPLTLEVSDNAAHGSLDLRADGSFTYIPFQDFVGTDSFTYRAFDGTNYSLERTVTIDVIGVPDAPIAQNNSYTAQQDTLLTIDAAVGVLVNDTDSDSDSLTAVLATDATNGSVELNPDGSFSYMPDIGYSGPDSFTYRASDGAVSSTEATVWLAVTANAVPVANNDSYSILQGDSLTVNAAAGVLANDTDINGDQLVAKLDNGIDETVGTLALNADGSFAFTPNLAFSGQASFTYIAFDGKAESSLATVTVSVGQNTAPVVHNDSYSLNEDSSLTADTATGVLANDTEPDGTPMTAVLETDASHGALTLNADGSFSYTPDANYSGPDSFTYYAFDGNLASSPVNVSLTVIAQPDLPQANSDSYSTPQDETLTIAASVGVLANDSDKDGDTLFAYLVTDALYGSLTLNADGSFSYKPDSGFDETDRFMYHAFDGSTYSSVTTVTISITPNNPPAAANDSYSTNEGKTLSVGAAAGVLHNDTDADGDALIALLDSTVSHGSLLLLEDGSFDYTPDPDYIGSDSFTYHAWDGKNASSIRTVFLNVIENAAPVARADTYGTSEDAPLSVPATIGLLANDTDAEGGPLSAVQSSNPAHGTLTLNSDGSFTYTPDENYTGEDSFTYQSFDGSSFSPIVTVTLNVQAVNDPPTGQSDSYSAVRDQTLNVGITAGVLANDSDVDSENMTAHIDTEPANGVVVLRSNGSFSYTPNADYTGPDSFTYTVSDGTVTSAPVQVSLAVLSDPILPIATNDSYGMNEDGNINVPVANGVLANDSSPTDAPLTAILITQPTDGVLTLNADGSLTYAPNADFTGPDIFTYAASDGASTSEPATVTINVQAVNDAPAANTDFYTTSEDEPISIAAAVGILLNDYDAEDDALTALLEAGPTHGTLSSFTPDGAFTYQPDAGYAGSDSFTYRANDGSATSELATVTITIIENYTPQTNSDTYTIAEDNDLVASAAAGVLANDSDLNGDALTVELIRSTSPGQIMLNVDGSFTYIPEANFNGTDSFSYRAFDGKAFSNVTTATVTIQARNDAPRALAETYTTREDTPLSVNQLRGVLSNDSDPEGSPLTAMHDAGPDYGALTLGTDGSFVYTPDPDFFGEDSFLYYATDGSAASEPATVTIKVLSENDAPIARADSYTTNEDTSLVVPAPGIVRNDSDPEGAALQPILVSAASHGSLRLDADNALTYTPDANFAGSDSFVYHVSDGFASSDNVTVTITIVPANDLPRGSSDFYSLTEDEPLTVTVTSGLLSNDEDDDGDMLRAAVETLPTHGVLALALDGSFTYTPDVHFFGDDSFTYRVYDGFGWSEPITVMLQVAAVNDAPIAQNDTYQIVSGARLSPTAATGVLTNDYDREGMALSAQLVTAPANGTLTLYNDGSFIYSSDTDYTGPDSFTYQASDGDLDSVPVSVMINVVGNILPVARSDMYEAIEDTPLVRTASEGLLANDSDGDGDMLRATIVTGPLSGTLTLASDGSFTYTPHENVYGTDSFT